MDSACDEERLRIKVYLSILFYNGVKEEFTSNARLHKETNLSMGKCVPSNFGCMEWHYDILIWQFEKIKNLRQILQLNNTVSIYFNTTVPLKLYYE